MPNEPITPYLLKVGLIVDSPNASKYVFDLAKWGQQQKHIRISHLVIQEKARPSTSFLKKGFLLIKKKGFREFINSASFLLLTRIERIRLRNYGGVHRDHLQQFDLSEVVQQSLTIVPIISMSGFVFRFSPSDIKKVKSLSLDLLIRCGSGILRGEILSSSKFGIISFHHADNRVNRGGPPGFWEVFCRQDASGFTIQQLTEELDGGNVLFRGLFQTQAYYLLNQANIYLRSNYFLKKLLSEIAENNALPSFQEAQPYSYRLFRGPTLSEQLTYISQLIVRMLRKLKNLDLLRKRYQWGVAFYASDWKGLVMWRAHQIINPPNGFLADPFVIRRREKDYCFVEEYNYDKEKGCISVYELRNNTSERLGEAINESFHLSFPFLFPFEGKLYMCPETNQTNDIRVYENIEFPLKWKLSKTLINNVSASDTMIFQKDNMWWMFTNIDPVAANDHSSMLFIFYADSPISDTWLPHGRNPVIVDSSKARNGGMLIHEGCIYRVSQKQSFGFYGAGTTINKIDVLNKNEYVETEFCPVKPEFFSNVGGTHHMHGNGHVTVFDFVKLV